MSSSLNNWQSGYVTVNGLKLHYTRTGGEKPPFVLAHGVTDDGLCWTPVAEQLEANYDVVMVDARGHGFSEAHENEYDIVTLASDLHGVIQALELKKPLILGHSMGAATTLVLAGTYPQAPRAILLEDPPAWWMPPPPQTSEQQAPHAGLVAWFEHFKRQTREEMLTEQRQQAQARWSEAELGPWADSKVRASPYLVNLFRSRLDRSIDWESMKNITCPVLLIRSDPNLGGIITPESAAALQALLPKVKVVPIPQAGHNIRREQFRLYLAAVCEFLAEV